MKNFRQANVSSYDYDESGQAGGLPEDWSGSDKRDAMEAIKFLEEYGNIYSQAKNILYSRLYDDAERSRLLKKLLS